MTNFYLRHWDYLHQTTQPFYWTVFDHETAQSTRFNFKHDAIVYRKLLPHATLYFHWYEQEFARLNVSIEPPDSHAELCRQRAQELRDSYNYIRLSFSGGADSLTALHSFVDNNIHLDEIVVVDYFDGSNYDDPMKSSGREIKLHALPHLKQIAHCIPNAFWRRDLVTGQVHDADTSRKLLRHPRWQQSKAIQKSRQVVFLLGRWCYVGSKHVCCLS